MSGDASTVGSLIATFLELTREMAVKGHTGRYIRLCNRQHSAFNEIKATDNGRNALRKLMDEDDVQIQFAVARMCKSDAALEDTALATLRRLAQRTDSIGREAQSSLDFRLPPPSETTTRITPKIPPFLSLPGRCTKDIAEHIVRESPMRERAIELIDLLRPCIGIWPVADPKTLTASRFGGMPAVPANFEWPVSKEEPYWFLAQINCSELGAAAKAYGLPRKGMLSFFADHDDVNGCDASGRGSVFYFSDVRALQEAALPVYDFDPQISCGMGFYENYELPHPNAEVIVPLNFTDEERDAFYDLGDAVSEVPFKQIPDDGYAYDILTRADNRSKLFGWPELIQDELATNFRLGLDQRLLVQLGKYHDGHEWHGWGPGGLVYFTIDQKDLAAKRFDRAEFDMQNT